MDAKIIITIDKDGYLSMKTRFLDLPTLKLAIAHVKDMLDDGSYVSQAKVMNKNEVDEVFNDE